MKIALASIFAVLVAGVGFAVDTVIQERDTIRAHQTVLDADLATLRDEKAVVEGRHAEARGALTRLRDEHTAVRADLTALSGQYADVEAQHAEAQDGLAMLHIQVDDLKAQQADLGKLRAENYNLSNDLKTASLERDDARKRRTALEAQTVDMQNDLTVLQGRLDALMARLERVERERDDALQGPVRGRNSAQSASDHSRFGTEPASHG